MAESTVTAEFVAKLGFSFDEGQYRRFSDCQHFGLVPDA
jgi:hypothetical protein